jgi:hypothetical protein
MIADSNPECCDILGNLEKNISHHIDKMELNISGQIDAKSKKIAHRLNIFLLLMMITMAMMVIFI